MNISTNKNKYRILRRSNDRKTDSLVLLAPFKPDEFIDHRPESWIFSFHRIIEEEANQQDVFENIGRPVIDSVLNGYNGTVFAYGQTGSGKTYTITGQISSNKCQGIVPRSLSYLFDFIKMHPENIYSVDVAYLEIYNEYGYDLLDRKQQQQQQQQQQVQVQQAMRLEDLPSERVYKCEISGTVLTEAKHINLSLHYLEQVIVCLNQENSSHIPYRNCLLTAILRDSLGGNCITTMLATLSISSVNLQETISTCRFAQRVALVRNEAKLILDHDLDSENKLLQLENEKLRKQIEELKNTLSLQDNKDRHDEKLDYYKNLVMQRDQEISVLLGLLKKAKAKLAQPEDLNKMVIKSKLKIRSKESIGNNKENTLVDNQNVKLCIKQMISAERLSKTTTKVLEPIEKHDVENNTLFEIKHSNLLEKSLEEKSIIEENIEKKDIPFNDSSKETNSLKQSFNLGTSNIEKDLEVKKIDENVDDNDMSCVHSNETSVNQLCNLIINNDNLVNNSITNDDQLIERQHIEEKVKSNNIDNDLEKNLPLTGDSEIDEEIIAFYKAKRSGGIY